MVTRALGFSIQVLLFKSPLIVSGFLTTHGGQHGVIHLWDNYACDIVGIRPVNLQFQYDSVFTLQLVHHIPQLEKSFSTGQLDDDGFHHLWLLPGAVKMVLRIPSICLL